MQPLSQWKSSITYSECVFVALCIQHAMCMCHIVICGVPGSEYLSTLSHKQNTPPPQKKKYLLKMKYLFCFFSTSFF